MLRSVLLLPLVFVFFGLIAPRVESATAPIPLLPDTGTSAAPLAATSSAPTPSAAPDVPAHVVASIEAPAEPAPPTQPNKLTIPSIGLSSRVVAVGLTREGEMDVPSGSSHDVGWYKNGTVPGEQGSAVIDAHVFAAFSKLKNISVGSSVYIETATHQKLQFRVVDMQVYKLGELTPDTLFGQNDAKRLNLITCAGKLTADHTTYDHRLVIYTKLVE